MAGRRVTEFEERDYYASPRRSDPTFEEVDRRRVVTRSPPPRPYDRTPAFLREDARRTEAGPMVLRQRDVESFERHHRSPSPVRRRPRSLDREDSRLRSRFVRREPTRSPSFERSRDLPPPRAADTDRVRTRVVDRRRERSLSSSSSSSSSPSTAPPRHIRGPIIERDVITHYRDIDHGLTRVRPPSPPLIPRPHVGDRTRETDIDISVSKDRNDVDVDVDVDVRRSNRRSVSRGHHHRHPYHDDTLLVVDDHRHRRSHSAAPIYSPTEEEGDYLASRIDSRGRVGEAWHGATKDWEIVDVPPGTERVRMDGAGGGSTDTTWSKYSGVRRTRFIPERDAPREVVRPKDWDRERDLEVEVDIKRKHSHAPAPPPAPPTRDMWTEISKDLVEREAIETMGYSYEEWPDVYRVTEYLRYDDVLQLTEITKDIRRWRRDHARDAYWRDDWQDGWDRRHRHHHHRRRPSWNDERVRETDIIYDSRRPYYR